MKDEKTKIFQSCIKEAFETIKNFLGSKIKGIPALNQSMTEMENKVDSDTELNAEKYYSILRLGFSTDNKNLIILTLNSLKVLVANKFVKGALKANNPEIVNSHSPRVLDELIDDTCRIFDLLKDENTLQNIVKLLHSVSKNNELHVHGDSLSKIIRVCVKICLTTESNTTATQCKNTLNHFLLNSFSFCELYKDKRKISEGNPSVFSRFVPDSALTCSYIPKTKTEYACEQVLKVLLDKVEINSACQVDLTKIIPNFPEECASHKFFDNSKVNSGVFGWCFVCREKADFYCSRTRMPVCSENCKGILAAQDEGNQEEEEDESKLFTLDTILILKNLGMMLTKEVESSKEEDNKKLKIIVLELLASLTSQPGEFFLSDKKLITMLKENIFDGLLLCSSSLDKDVFALSLNVIFNLWNFFREHIKSQLGVVLENVFLAVLRSGNSSYTHKEIVLEFVCRLTNKPSAFVELYINFDCDLEEKEIMNELLTIMCRIAQGRYSASEHQLNAEEEMKLRKKAVSALSNLIKGIEMFIVDQAGFLDKSVETYETEISIDRSTEMKEKFDFARKVKYTISYGISKFNIKPKKGIKYLVTNGVIKETPESIGRFLKNTAGLNKELLGEYVGTKENSLILEAFLSNYDFSGMNLLSAIRMFLLDFKLPGEGQVIDRIVTFFSEKFFEDNPSELEKDFVYYLAFATIMLQTHLHNENIKEKFTKKNFFELVSKFDTNDTIDKAYLEGIYDSIEANPLSLSEIDEQKAIQEILKNSSKRKDFFRKESIRLLNEGKNKLKASKNKAFITDFEINEIVPLMETAWTAFLGVFSQIIELTEDDKMVEEATASLSNCIQILGLLKLNLQKEAVFQGLYKFTNLNQGKPILKKNIACIQNVLNLATNFGKHMKGCWTDILTLLSSIDMYFSINDDSDIESYLRNYHKNMTDREIEAEVQNIQVMVKLTSPDKYDKIYNHTKSLDLESFLDFLDSITEVSKNELSEDSPRIYSLQKIVEIAEMNMYRPNRALKQIWQVLSEYFVEVGSNKEVSVSSFGIDSLRQLVRKFLQRIKGEDNKKYIEPFEMILLNNLEDEFKKEYVVTSLINLVLNEVDSVKNGWRIVFNVYQTAAADSSEETKKRIFDSIKQIMSNSFNHLKEYFLELTQCLRKFSQIFPRDCLMLLYETVAKLDDSECVYSLLSTIGNIISTTEKQVKRTAICVFFNILNKEGLEMTDFLFKKTFNLVLVPLIEDLVKLDSAEELDQIMLETCSYALSRISDISLILADLFDQLIYITKNMENCSVMVSINVIKFILVECRALHQSNAWDIVISKICLLAEEMMLPTELSSVKKEELSDELLETIDRKLFFCVIQHNLINIIGTLIEDFNECLSFDNKMALLSCLSKSYTTTLRFNRKVSLRIEIKRRRNVYDLKQPIALFQHQQNSANVIQKIFEGLIEEGKDVRSMVIKNSLELIQDFLQCLQEKYEDEEEASEYERVLENLAGVLIRNVFPILEKVGVQHDQENRQLTLKLLLDLIPCNFEKVRQLTKDLLALIILS